MKHEGSHRLFHEAQRYMPGGVSSPVRAFKAVGLDPVFMSHGEGSRLFDEDGNCYIDYVCSWGPMILGHAYPAITRAIQEAAVRGTSFGAPTSAETALARIICAAVPSIDIVRFVSSGTEAAMSALRLARAFTGRDQIIKFAGCYHGHSDGLLARAGSGLATLGIPDCPGVPKGYARNTLIAKYNDTDTVEAQFKAHPGKVAAVIVEPVAANMGVVAPEPGFLEALRRLTQEHGALLIFDEVITGFRLAYGGAQSMYGVVPDLTCLGKVIGGGLPVGAYGGRKDIMDMVAPLGPVYQAGTLSGNPLAMAAGIQALKALGKADTYEALEERSAALERRITGIIERAQAPATVSRVGSLLTLFFTAEKVRDYKSAAKSDTGRFAGFFRNMLERGIYWPPSQFEAAFVSLAHTPEDVDLTLEACEEAVKGL